MPIRTRLLLWYTGSFAAALALFAGMVWLGARQALNADLDHWLNGQAEGLERFLRLELRSPDEAGVTEEAREFCTALPGGSGLQLLDSGGSVLLSRPTVRPPIEHRVGSVISSRWDGSPVRVVARETSIRGRRYRFLLWRTNQEIEATLNRLGGLLLTLAPILMLLSAGGGWWLSRRALAPVDEMTAAARRVSLDDLGARLPVPPHGDELSRLGQAWNEMLDRLEHSAGRLRQFTADASHELRTPLAVMRTTAELALRHERTPEEYREALAGVRLGTEEMTRMIENLLELARADAGQLPVSRTKQDLSAVVDEAAAHVRPLAEQKAIRIESSSQGQLAVSGDRGLLRRLLLIVLDNALKFTPRQGRIAIRAFREGPACVVEVTDNGCGIAPQDLPRIFDRFYQADAARSGGGSGLGLAIAQWIVLSHRGTIQAESEPGQGTRVRIALPAAGA